MIEYEINPRPAALGAGWKLAVKEGGVEIAGGVFPPGDEGYADALDVATSFLPEPGPETDPVAPGANPST